jgi:hypothetical protein
MISLFASVRACVCIHTCTCIFLYSEQFLSVLVWEWSIPVDAIDMHLTTDGTVTLSQLFLLLPLAKYVHKLCITWFDFYVVITHWKLCIVLINPEALMWYTTEYVFDLKTLNCNMNSMVRYFKSIAIWIFYIFVSYL